MRWLWHPFINEIRVIVNNVNRLAGIKGQFVNIQPEFYRIS